jgi:hypothetical protein
MKKLLTIAALIGATSLSFGQGQVTFANSGTTFISTNSAHNGPATGPTVANPVGSGTYQYVFALFVAPSTVNAVTGVNDANWQTVVGYATNSSSATSGRIAGGQPVVPGFLTGTTANFIIRAWSANVAGTDWTTARAWQTLYENTGNVPFSGFWYNSTVEQIAVGGAPNPITATFGATPGTSFQGFTLNLETPIPEPVSFALAGLGAAAMLIFRRRKQ